MNIVIAAGMNRAGAGASIFIPFGGVDEGPAPI